MTDTHDRIRLLLEEIGHPPPDDDDDDLALASLEVVMLHDAIERECDVRLPARRVTPETFRSVSSLAALVDELGGDGG